MNDQTRSVRLRLPDGSRLQIDHVPTDITASAFLSHLASLDRFADPALDLSLHQHSAPIAGSSIMIDDEFDIVMVPSHRSPFKSLFILFLFISIHVIPFAVFQAVGSWAALCSYSALVLAFGLLCFKLKLPLDLIKEVGSCNWRQYIIIEIIYWFVKSFSPSFRLEQVLIHD
jgi:hypothetical protein